MITPVQGQTGIRRNDAVLFINQPKPELVITTKRAEINLRIEQVRIKIDQSQCFSEAGRKDIFELTEEYARRGKEAVLEAISNIVEEGNRMRMIENKAEAVVEIATDKALPPPADFNITLMPQSRPKIEVEGGVYFYPQPGEIKIRFKVYSPEVNVVYPQTDLYL